jgi:pimeloyl-ACP methyl ester carboxylesterase
MYDDQLIAFEAQGLSLPAGGVAGSVVTGAARIWYTTFGKGSPVLLLHGGMGHAGNFAQQIEPLVEAGRQVVAIDSRGQGRSSRDDRPYSYDLMASDTFAVMDTLGMARAAVVGWSDGACIGLAMAKARPVRVAGVFFFACNVDSSGTLPFEMTDTIARCISRHGKDYAMLSPTPDEFQLMADALQVMQRQQPNYSRADLEGIAVPVTVAQAERDEFIRNEHARYIAYSIPRAQYVELLGVSHFAPVQRPEVFNGAVLKFLAELPTH